MVGWTLVNPMISEMNYLGLNKHMILMMKSGLCKGNELWFVRTQRYFGSTVKLAKNMKFFTKRTKETALYLKITVNFTGIYNKYLQLFYNKERLDLTCQENIFSLSKKKIVVNLFLLLPVSSI